MPRIRVLATVAIMFIHTLMVLGQAVQNPDISVIPRFHLSSTDGTSGSFEQPGLSMEELEVYVQAYLNPYAKGDISLAKHGAGEEPIEVEEAYATFLRGLPLDLNVRIGKFRAEFGKFNMMHPHAWPFISSPLAPSRFLGEEGANALGAGVSSVLPTGSLYSRLSFEVLRGDFTQTIDPRGTEVAGTDPVHEDHDHAGVIGMLDTLGRPAAYAMAARLMSFIPLTEESDIEIGLSGLTGIHDPQNAHRFFYANIDVKYKWKPDAYTSLTVQGEALLSTRNVTADRSGSGVSETSMLTTGGGFLFADYQFLKAYSIGARYDWSQSPYAADDRALGFSVFAGFYPVEETSAFRLEYAQSTFHHSDGDSKTVRTVTLQFLFSLGPHKAHAF